MLLSILQTSDLRLQSLLPSTSESHLFPAFGNRVTFCPYGIVRQIFRTILAFSSGMILSLYNQTFLLYYMN